MKRRVVCAVMTTLAVGLVGCGGGGSSPSTPNPSSPITKGLLVITQVSDGLYGMTPAGLWRLRLPIEVRAMNDIPLTLNHARLTLYGTSGAEVLRAEVTANDIIAQAGSNYVIRDRWPSRSCSCTSRSRPRRSRCSSRPRTPTATSSKPAC